MDHSEAEILEGSDLYSYLGMASRTNDEISIDTNFVPLSQIKSKLEFIIKAKLSNGNFMIQQFKIAK